MKKALTAAIILSILFVPSLAEAQAPTPPDVPTLGPATFFYADDSGYSIKILSPQNQSSYSNQIPLIFTIEVTTMLGQFGNVGYSLDGGIINSVSTFVNKTVDKTGFPDWYYWRTTVSANVILPTLSEGVHNVTLYYGWQYLGIPENPSLKRFEVSSYKTVEFTVDTAPPTISQLSIVNQTYNNQTIPLSFYLSEKTSWVAYNLDNKGNTTLQGNTTLTGLSSGFHNIVVYANDTLGNMGKTDTVSFEVKKEDVIPVIPLSGIAVVIGVAVALVATGLLVYHKKRKRGLATV